jgi:cupin fold WbuC family metalloprotein
MTTIKRLDNALVDQLMQQAAQSPRRRSHHNFHQRLDEPVQRLLIALQPGTYIRPHQHPQRHKWEMMITLRGRIKLLLFSDDGCVNDVLVLGPDTPLNAVELPPNTWHTLMPVDSAALIMEVKQGPYLDTDVIHFADWAPQENSPEAEPFLNWCQQAENGDRYQS